MEFDGQYLTYSEYQSFGGTLEEMPFNLLEFKARKEIDRATSMKLVGKGQNYTSVKVCVYDLIPVIKSYQEYTSNNKNISSTNTDGYSESYNVLQSSFNEIQQKELNAIIFNDLFGTIVDGENILYLGLGNYICESGVISTC